MAYQSFFSTKQSDFLTTAIKYLNKQFGRPDNIKGVVIFPHGAMGIAKERLGNFTKEYDFIWKIVMKDYLV